MNSKVKDLICGMEIDEKTAVTKSEYMGKTYYFMSASNKITFDENPAKYIEGGEQEMVKDSNMKI